jgi:pSer/pThr/pTyr-binding forkhead associated (FHA) protein
MRTDLGAVAAGLARQEEYLATTIPLNAAAEEPQPGFVLVVSRDGSEVARYPLGENPLTIGRSPSCSVVLEDSAISRKHCSVVYTPDGLSVTDHNSTNGTFFGEDRIAGTRLLPPDIYFLIGSFQLSCVSG